MLVTISCTILLPKSEYNCYDLYIKYIILYLNKVIYFYI